MRYVLASFITGTLVLSACTNVEREPGSRPLDCWVIEGGCPNQAPQSKRAPIEAQLQEAGFERQSDEGAVPSVWVDALGIAKVSLGDDLGDSAVTYVEMTFSEGTLRCDIGVTQEGSAPLVRMQQLHTAGYVAAKSGTITVDGKEVSTGCKPV